MAVTLGLYQGFATGGTVVSNLLSTADLRLQAGGWTAKTAGIDEPLVWDVFDLVLRDSSAAESLANYYIAQKFISDARMYIAGKSFDPCWLRMETTSGYVQHTLVYDGQIEVPGQGKWGPLQTSDGKGYLRLALVHSAVWERPTPLTVTTTNLSVLGGIWKPTLTYGDLDGRITEFEVGGHATTDLEDFWIGIRRHPDAGASFVALWEAENGHVMTDSATAADANASGGYRVTISFATDTTMIQRWYMMVDDATAGTAYVDFIGNYLILARIGCSGIGSTFLLQLHSSLFGNSSSSPALSETSFTPTTTNYQLIELGNMQIPPIGYKSYTDRSGLCQYTTITLYASRPSGSNSLYLDAIILIPTDSIITAKDALIDSDASSLRVVSEPDGNTTGFHQFGTIPYGLIEYSANMLLPRDGNVIVLAAQDTNAATPITTTASTLSMTYTPRYSLYRDT